jgi:hypothetical protein
MLSRSLSRQAAEPTAWTELQMPPSHAFRDRQRQEDWTTGRLDGRRHRREHVPTTHLTTQGCNRSEQFSGRDDVVAKRFSTRDISRRKRSDRKDSRLTDNPKEHPTAHPSPAAIRPVNGRVNVVRGVDSDIQTKQRRALTFND